MCCEDDEGVTAVVELGFFVAASVWYLAELPEANIKNYSPGHMEQTPSRGHEANPQSGLGVGCKLCSSSKILRGLSVRAQVWCITISPLFSVLGGFLVPVSPA